MKKFLFLLFIPIFVFAQQKAITKLSVLKFNKLNIDYRGEHNVISIVEL